MGNSSSVPVRRAVSARALIWAALLLHTVGPLQARDRALLVGCTVYPHLEETWWLEGPEHDTALFRETLLNTPFGLDPLDIHVLSGWPAEPSRRPTLRNIEAALASLATSVTEHDRVILFLAGHGSQQPASPDPEDPESDSLDELFLPADVEGWQGGIHAVKNALPDDQLAEWLRRIRERGAFVWLIVDACHAGTLTRGAPSSVERLRRVPWRALASATASLSRPSPRGDSGAPGGQSGIAPERRGRDGGIAALYAAQPEETTSELRLPSPRGPFHGLFTYTLVETLTSAHEPLTYRELAERIGERYRQKGRFRPTPVVEGGGADRLVTTGQEQAPAFAHLQAVPMGDGRVELRVDAGALHGLREGTVLAVRSSSRSGETAGHVRVNRSGALSSAVAPVAWDGVPEPKIADLPAGAECEVVHHAFGPEPIRIAVRDPNPRARGPSGLPTSGDLAALVSRALADARERHGALLERTEEAALADWFVDISSAGFELSPAAGWPEGSTPAPFLLEAAVAESGLPTALARIARAQTLLRLAGELSSRRGPIRLDVELTALGPDGRHRPIEPGPAGVVLREGQQIAIRTANRSPVPVDLTLLFVDSLYETHALFPTLSGGEYNRLAPGEVLVTPPLLVTADTLGAEQLIAIAVRGDGVRRSDLSHLGQPGPGPAPKRGEGMSPLQELLDGLLLSPGRTRGLRATEIEAYTVDILTWQTTDAAPPRQRPG